MGYANAIPRIASVGPAKPYSLLGPVTRRGNSYCAEEWSVEERGAPLHPRRGGVAPACPAASPTLRRRGGCSSSVSGTLTVSPSTMDAIRQDLENLRAIIGQGPGWQQRLRDALDPSFYLKALLLANPATLPFRMPVAQARD